MPFAVTQLGASTVFAWMDLKGMDLSVQVSSFTLLKGIFHVANRPIVIASSFVHTDIDECTEGLHNCSENAECHDVEGSYNCICNRGFRGDGTSCISKCSPPLSLLKDVFY